MKDLNSRDINLYFEAVERLDAFGDSCVGERVLAAVETVVPNDLIAIDSFPSGSVEHLDEVHWNNNPEMLTPEIGEICSVVFEENPYDNPLIVEQVHRGRPGVLKLSDFGDQGRFRETAYYNEIMRRVDFDSQMAVMLQAAAEMSYAVAIQRKGTDFTERERKLMTLLTPHLTQAMAITVERERWQERERRLTAALDATDCGVITVSGSGKILHRTELADIQMERYFGHGRGASMLPPELSEFLSGADLSLPASTVFSQPGSALHVSVAAGEGEFTLLLEESAEPTPECMQKELGLTPRQSEIMYWICRGKSYDVIATLTGASLRTVQKHAENIFQRLGVESRAAAASAAFERLRNCP